MNTGADEMRGLGRREGEGTRDQGCRAPMNTGADEMRGSSDCYHQIMPAQTRQRGNQVQGSKGQK